MSYEKTTWETGDVVTAEKLNNIENGIENAGSLPSVTAEDDGDVLTVVSGAWAKATPSGGGGAYVIDTEDTLDKSYNELVALVQGGSLVSAYSTSDGITSFMYLSRLGTGEYDGATYYYAEFMSVTPLGASTVEYVAPDADTDLARD